MVQLFTALKIQVMSALLFGKTAYMAVVKANGKLAKASRVAMFNMVNTGNYIEITSGNRTLTREDSGALVGLSQLSGFTVTLPAVEKGLRFKFLVILPSLSGNIVIDSAEGDNIYGAITNRAGAAGVAASAEDQINLVAIQAITGDQLEFISSGGGWFVSGVTDVAAGSTATDPS